MNLAHSSLPSEGHRLVLQLRSELHAGMCTRSRPAQPLLEPDWRSSSDLTCISSSTRTWDRAAGERDQRSGEIELAEKDRIEPFVLLDLARLVIRFSSWQNSCFLRSQPPDAPAPPACGPAARERARCPRLPLPPPMGGSSPLHLLLGPAAPATGVGGRPGPGSALGPPPSRQRPPWGCWAWWWWLEGVEPPVTGLYGLHTLVIPELVPHARSPWAARVGDAGARVRRARAPRRHRRHQQSLHFVPRRRPEQITTPASGA